METAPSSYGIEKHEKVNNRSRRCHQAPLKDERAKSGTVLLVFKLTREGHFQIAFLCNLI